VKPFTLNQGLAVLENTMKYHHTQILTIETDFTLLNKFFPNNTKLVSEIKMLGDSSSLKDLDSNVFWEEYDSAETRKAKCEIMKKTIKVLIRLNLKLDKSEEINDHANFQDLGMDSLLMVEMKNALQTSVGKRVKISINSVRDCKTVQELGNRLVELISGEEELSPPTHEELKELILHDSVLPEEIQVNDGIIPAQKLSDCSVALIFGVTGTLGSYILREVLQQPSIKKVYCILLQNMIFSPKERLAQVLQKKNLLQDIDMEKVTCVMGDMTQSQFGMNIETYTKLCQEVEIVLNVAVEYGYGEYYMKAPNPNHSRNVNLNGVKNTLIFASQVRLKHVYHSTTVLAETQMGADGRFWEEWPISGEMDNENLPNSAYHISKYVSDLLVAQAVERGIPCKGFRFAYMVGDSVQGGNFQIMDGLMITRMLIYMYMGYMPARNVPISVLPVDLCAKFSVCLFFNEETGNEMFNVINPYFGDERELDEIAENFGVFIDVLEPDEFLEKAKSFKDDSQIAEFVKSMIASREKDLEMFADYMSAPLLKWLEGDKEVFLSKKLVKFCPNYPSSIKPTWEFLKKDLQYAKDTGIFDKFGIKQTLNQS
jgi:thioester reductase-like protein/acyl carrier protein